MKTYILTLAALIFMATQTYGTQSYTIESKLKFGFARKTDNTQTRSILFKRTDIEFSAPVHYGAYSREPLKAWGATLIVLGILGGISTAAYHYDYIYGEDYSCGCGYSTAYYDPNAPIYIITGYAFSGTAIIAGSIMIYKSNHPGSLRTPTYYKRRPNYRYEDGVWYEVDPR